MQVVQLYSDDDDDIQIRRGFAFKLLVKQVKYIKAKQ